MLYTSYFGNMKKIRDAYPDMRFCSIAGKRPDWFTLGDNGNFEFRELAPKYSWWKYWHDHYGENPDSDDSISYYTKKYKETVLSMLRQYYVKDRLYEFSEGNDVCMLCYEKPDRFCHRKLVSKWLGEYKMTCREIIV